MTIDRNVQALAQEASYVEVMATFEELASGQPATIDDATVRAQHLAATKMLDYRHPAIQQLVDDRGWALLPEHDRVGAVYGYVRDGIPFGYNAGDDLSASAVLEDGYGQCNTKTTLLMALLRAVGIPCRLHASTIHKELQKGVVNGVVYRLAPTNIDHTWAEVDVDGRWTRLEGVILDIDYLDGLRAMFPTTSGSFLGYAVGTDDLACPDVDWCGTDTGVQTTGVNADHGEFDDPDSFYAQLESTLSGAKAWLFRHVVRHTMNRNVARIRSTRH